MHVCGEMCGVHVCGDVWFACVWRCVVCMCVEMCGVHVWRCVVCMCVEMCGKMCGVHVCKEMCGVHVQLFHFLSCPHLHQPDNGDYWVRYVTLLLCRARRDLTAVPLPTTLPPSLTEHYAVDGLRRRLLRWLQRSSVCPRKR